MLLCSAPFALLTLVGLLLHYACRTIETRRYVLLLLSAVFISAQVDSLSALLPLAAFVASLLACIVLVDRFKSRMLFVASIATILVMFVYLKQYTFVRFLPSLPLAFTTLGLSYILFRGLHVLIDTHQEEKRRTDLQLAPLLAYMTSFLTFVAGPIQRYEEYRDQEREWDGDPKLTSSEVSQALLRIAMGCSKLLLVSPMLLRLYGGWLGRLDRHGELFAVAAAAYVLFLYFNFSGYMDVVIGVGRLFGWKLPENFDKPFTARNFLELWTRWHMTLSEWFKTYVFNPVLQALCQRCNRPVLVPYLGALSYFVVFFLLGVWHGASAQFLVLGLALGVGVSANKLYEVEMTRRLGKAGYQRLAARPAYQMAARAAMLTYFSLAATLSWEHPNGLAGLRNQLATAGFGGLARGVLFLFAGIMAIEGTLRAGSRLWARLTAKGIGVRTAWEPIAASVHIGLVALFLHESSAQAQAEAARIAEQSRIAATAGQPESAPAPITSTEIFYGKH